MRYNLETAHQRCSEVGVTATFRSNERLDVIVAPGIVLCIENGGKDEDCRIGFAGTPWHAHDDLMFSDGQASFVEIGHLDMLSCLADGRVLICELRKNGIVTDRWLIHRDCNDEFKHMEPGEEIRVFRAHVG